MPSPRWANTAWALALVALGAFLLLANFGLIASRWLTALARLWPVLLIAAGVLLLAYGRIGLGFAPAPFLVERGSAASARLTARTGVVDLTLRAAAEADEALIFGRYAGPGGPAVEAEKNGGVQVRLERGLTPLGAVGDWDAALSPEVPWRLELSTGLGNLDLDLRGLTVPALELSSSLGDVRLTLPDRGECAANLAAFAGDVSLRVPPGVAVHLSFQRSLLGKLRLDATRFRAVAPGVWASPDFASATNRASLTIVTTIGDVSLR